MTIQSHSQSAIAALFTVCLAACSSSDSGNTSGGSANLNDSPAMSEQFGTIQQRQMDPDSTEANQALFVNAYNEFSLDVHKALVNSAPDENVIVSGYSLATALTLLMSGTAGNSRAELASLLHLDTLDPSVIDATANAVDLQLMDRNNDELILRSANRLFVSQDYTFNIPFLDNAVGNFGAPITTADFVSQSSQVVRDINAWANEQTNGFIPSILDRIDPGTVIAILNATLLDAGWSEEFFERGDGQFTNLSGETVSVPYFGNQEFYQAVSNDNLTAVDIRYAGDELSMLIVMPDQLSTAEMSLNAAGVADVVSQLSSQDVILAVPEWSFEQTIDAKELLVPLGLPSGAMDFSAMLTEDPGNIGITQAIQKARIEVDKDGTRAAAVSAIVSGTGSIPSEPIRITFNRPFWYAIRDRESGLILFSGRVVSTS
ncbi:MAG: serpin family protein [Granulosicoccus sp.]|nr:serpin family protein [Granulosicoccus sp.]